MQRAAFAVSRQPPADLRWMLCCTTTRNADSHAASCNAHLKRDPLSALGVQTVSLLRIAVSGNVAMPHLFGLSCGWHLRQTLPTRSQQCVVAGGSEGRRGSAEQ